MTYLPHKESYPSITSSLNLFNHENVDVSVKHGYYEQFHPQQPLSESLYLQIFSSEDFFIVLSSTFIDLNIVVKKKSDNISHCYRQSILWKLYPTQLAQKN